MSKLIEEVRLWNTPLIDAYLLWEFTHGYQKNHPNNDAPIGILHFVALPILKDKTLSERISNRRDSLQSYVRGLQDHDKFDSLLNLQNRIDDLKMKTLTAIDVAIACGLLVWDTNDASLYARSLKKKPSRGKRLESVHVKEGLKAETLGKWFSQHDIRKIATYLKVEF